MAQANVVSFGPGGERHGEIWERALEAMRSPFARLLFTRQALLIDIRRSGYQLAGPDELIAVVLVAQSWLAMTASQQDMLANALGEVTGRPVAVVLIPVADQELAS